MSGASTHNQNRLHLGFHYMRSFKTRDECIRGYSHFMKEFPFLTRPVPCNLYIIDKRSWIDTMTIRSILDQHQIPYEEYPNEYAESFLNTDRIESILRTEERVIDPELSKRFFEDELQDILLCECDYRKHFSPETRVLSFHDQEERFDHVVYCTFDENVRSQRIGDCRVEYCMSLVYECHAPFFDKALTVIDGPFFSLYPYIGAYYTLTHVTHTVITESEQAMEKTQLVTQKRARMEAAIIDLFPDFLKYFTYSSYFVSTKTKQRDAPSDDRSVRYVFDKRLRSLSIYGGKITGVFDAYDACHAHLMTHEIK